jgi:transposase
MSPELAEEAGDAHTIGRKSARRPRMEVLPRAERRRSWTTEEKREIVGESLGQELTPTEVARKHGISTGQIYTWRQQLLGLQGSVVTRTAPQFAPVELTSLVSEPDLVSAASPALTSPSISARPEGLIEILLPGGVSLRVDSHVDARALRRVLSALEGR